MPGDFRQFFDIRKLDDQSLGQIAFVLQSPAYNESFRPYLEGVLRSLDRMWKDRSRARMEEYPDDFLAGGVIFGEGLLKFFEQLISEVSIERIHASMEFTPEEEYDMRRAAGQVKPVVGLDQPALPAPPGPEEDY